jgi:hypothetical protein
MAHVGAREGGRGALWAHLEGGHHLSRHCDDGHVARLVPLPGQRA